MYVRTRPQKTETAVKSMLDVKIMVIKSEASRESHRRLLLSSCLPKLRVSMSMPCELRSNPKQSLI